MLSSLNWSSNRTSTLDNLQKRGIYLAHGCVLYAKPTDLKFRERWSSSAYIANMCSILSSNIYMLCQITFHDNEIRWLIFYFYNKHVSLHLRPLLVNYISSILYKHNKNTIDSLKMHEDLLAPLLSPKSSLPRKSLITSTKLFTIAFFQAFGCNYWRSLFEHLFFPHFWNYYLCTNIPTFKGSNKKFYLVKKKQCKLLLWEDV